MPGRGFKLRSGQPTQANKADTETGLNAVRERERLHYTKLGSVSVWLP
jgi:hypothetical protein